jgi:hypothetical protein
MGESPSFAEIRNQYMDVSEEFELNISSRSPIYVPPFGRKPTSFTKMSSKTKSLLSVRLSNS